MKFKNNGESVKVRTGNLHGYIWQTVRRNSVADLPEEIGKLHGFEEFKEKLEEEKSVKKPKKSKKG